MKRCVILICLIGAVIYSAAQSSFDKIAVTTNKTTSLIFPFPIAHVDRGTRDVLVQQVKEADNILLIKAGSNNFRETNLSVVTSDGSVYSFPVGYKNNPEKWVYTLPPQTSFNPSSYAQSILNNPPTMHGVRDKKWQILAKVSGIYIRGNTLYYQLLLINQSTIDYDIDFLRFYIRDKRRSKRTAIQENELKPLCIAGNIKSVKAFSRSKIVVAVDKFTIPDAKFLAIEVNEKNGGRHLFMKVSNKKIIQAIMLPDIK